MCHRRRCKSIMKHFLVRVKLISSSFWRMIDGGNFLWESVSVSWPGKCFPVENTPQLDHTWQLPFLPLNLSSKRTKPIAKFRGWCSQHRCKIKLHSQSLALSVAHQLSLKFHVLNGISVIFKDFDKVRIQTHAKPHSASLPIKEDFDLDWKRLINLPGEPDRLGRKLILNFIIQDKFFQLHYYRGLCEWQQYK
jgi:hypothetical protein